MLGYELQRQREVCVGVAEISLGTAHPGLVFGMWVISASHWRVLQDHACQRSPRHGWGWEGETPVLEPWLSPDHLLSLPPSSADPDPHGRNSFTA